MQGKKAHASRAWQIRLANQTKQKKEVQKTQKTHNSVSSIKGLLANSYPFSTIPFKA
jgi:hypothetical protein